MPRGGARPGAGRKRTKPQATSAPVLNSGEQQTGKRKPPNAGKGRPKGVPNKATTEAKELAAAILGDERYVKKLRSRAFAGKLHPSVETMLWYYKSGKPKETVEHKGRVGLVDLLAPPPAEANA